MVKLKTAFVALAALAVSSSTAFAQAGEGDGIGASNLGQTLFANTIQDLVAETHVSSFDEDCNCTFTPSANALSGEPTEFTPSENALSGKPTEFKPSPSSLE